MRVNHHTHISIAGDPMVRYHCEQGGTKHSLRIGAFSEGSIYLTGTVEELHAFGVAVIEQARAIPLPGPDTNEVSA